MPRTQSHASPESNHSPAARRDRGGSTSATTRLLASVGVGAVVGTAVSFAGPWQVALLVGWMAAAALFVVWMWVTIWPMDAGATKAHSSREDPGRAATDATFLLAALASLIAVGLLLLGGASNAGGKPAQAALSLGSVALAWASVHTLFTARYARLYYAGPAGVIDFHDPDPPRYSDFAYLALTIGMTFQVSDTDLQTAVIRATALRHALLSYVFGVGIIATMVNLVAGLSK
jgi:uncharacterized membrane protein